ncbi:voltage-gated chloride channel protein (plasmid) [Clostridium novyi]|uniref:voltage-gated chloride channel family protein n=1 Tax=Clostridium novyi TaxID=1542 RepID=UPI000EA14F9B|nr:voltage-gated chloride channel family protein [Clostridium novyi]AYF55361.1 voltage-gated chloride channel protein [Clostridium novyi]
MNYNKKEIDTFELPFLKWSIIGSSIGIIIGVVIALFLLCLESATKFRSNNPYILFLLPIGGVLVSFLYYKYGSNSSKGNNLIIEKINEGCEDIPLRMIPLVFFGTVVTHLLGGSAGREGTGVQIGASIGENIGKLLKLNKYENRIIIIAGVSGGFSAIFGTPLAGTIFGLEVSVIGKMSYEALIPCLAASILGNSVVSFLGIKHSHYIIKEIPNLSIISAFKIVLASIVFGLISRLFSKLTHKLKYIFSKVFKNIFIKSFIGGIFVIVLTLIIGDYKYLGLSLPLMENAFKGHVHPMDFLGKLVFTSVTLGSGYQGGEVTPLFVIGSTLGSSLSALLNLSPSFLASLGLISVFTGATNTPIASFILGIEMFGSKGAIYMLIACSISYTFSGHTGIYTSQSIGIKKSTFTFLKNILNG